jgi:hypothetical protein
MRDVDVHNVGEVVSAIRLLESQLVNVGARKAAWILEQACTGFYTTSTEALMALADALAATSETWEARLSSEWCEYARLLLAQTKKLMNLI